MTFKEIAVYVDSLPETDTRLHAAVDLARRQGAHLVGVYVAPAMLGYTPSDSWAVGAGLTEVIERHRIIQRDREALMRRHFTDLTATLEIPAEWRSVTLGTNHDRLISSARYADLTIVGQRDEEGDRSSWLPVLVNSGSPALVFPEHWSEATFGSRALVAWNASREARRALLNALPLLADARTVTILVVNPTSSETGHGEEPGADVARYLARHGIQAEVEQVAAADRDAGLVILERAAAWATDLIVMGAYGHSRTREFVLGGVTRTMLRAMPVPVLMAN